MSKDIVVQKSFPENYPSDALSILRAMSFTDGAGIKLVGSMSLRSQQYAGDYDGYEVVKLNEKTDAAALDALATRFKSIIRKLKSMNGVYIGDIKAGSVEEWRVLSRKAEVSKGKVVGYNAVQSRSVVDRLLASGVITEGEAKKAMELLKPNPTPVELVRMKGLFKFHIVRWTPEEVLAGEKTLRDGRVFTLQEAFSSPTISKLDVIGFVENNRFTDFSVIYEFQNKGKILNPDVIDIEKSLRESIIFYESEGDKFKVLKRMFALAKYKNNLYLVKKLQPVLNGDLGRIYHVLGDVKTLISLLEEHRPSMKKVYYEIDQFKRRLANVYELHSYLRSEPYLLGLIDSAVRTSSKDGLLRKLKELLVQLDRVLQRSAEEV